MICKIGLSGMGMLFLFISPALRAEASKELGFAVLQVVHYGPYSYVAIALACLAIVARALNPNPRPL